MSPSFIIPSNHSKLKPHALVFVNITDRPGAREEAKAVIDSLNSIGFIVYYKERYDFHDLKTAFETKFCDIKDESS